MKYKVTLEDRTDMKDIQRDLKHCRINFIIKEILCYDCIQRAPECEGYSLRFITKNKKVLEYMGFSEEQIKSFRDYSKPLKPKRYQMIQHKRASIYCRANFEDIEIPF